MLKRLNNPEPGIILNNIKQHTLQKNMEKIKNIKYKFFSERGEYFSVKINNSL